MKTGLDDYLCHPEANLNVLLARAGKAEKPPEDNRAPRSFAKARILDPWVPFPTDSLPDPLAEFVRQGAAALGCDESFLALPALAGCASLIGNTRTVELKPSWREPCVIWAGTIGDSGTLKSPAHYQAVSHLFAIQRKLHKDFKAKLAAWRNGDKETEKPPQEKVICGDITVEKLANVLEDNPRGLLVSRDELSGWIGSFTRYKARGVGSDLPNWLEMHRAGAIVVDRKTGDRPSLFVPRAAVSVCGGIQPGILMRSLTSEFFDAGLAARLLLAYPPRQPKRWSDAKIDWEVIEDYHGTLDDLRELPFGKDGNGENIPCAVILSPDAKKVWVEFYNSFAREQAESEGEVAAALSKIEGYAARLALLHHVVGRVYLDAEDRLPIQPCSVEAGVTLARWFAREARRIYQIFTETSAERDSRKLIEFIRARGGSITVRQLQRSNSRKYPTAEQADVALCDLVLHYGSWSRVPTGPEGGQHAKTFTLHPTPDTTDTTDADHEGDGEPSTDTTPPTGQKANNDMGSVGSVMRRAQHEEHTNGFADPEPVGGSVGNRVECGDAWEEL
jgi:hypothetical protein